MEKRHNILAGDINSALNPNVKKLTAAARKILEWEAAKKIIILNDKTQPIIK